MTPERLKQLRDDLASREIRDIQVLRDRIYRNDKVRLVYDTLDMLGDDELEAAYAEYVGPDAQE